MTPCDRRRRHRGGRRRDDPATTRRIAVAAASRSRAVTGIKRIVAPHGRSTSSNGAFRSASPSGATRSSTWKTVIASQGTERPLNAASMSAGVVPPLNATVAAPRPRHCAAQLPGDRRGSFLRCSLRIGSDDDVHRPYSRNRVQPPGVRSIATVNPDAQRQGVVAGVAAYLVWGALTLYWRHLHSFDAIELIGWRVICSAILMSGVLSITHRWQHLRPVARRSTAARLGHAVRVVPRRQLDHLRVGRRPRPRHRDGARLLPVAARHDGARRGGAAREAQPGAAVRVRPRGRRRRRAHVQLRARPVAGAW